MGVITEEVLSFKVDLRFRVRVTFTMIGSVVNHHLLIRYESLLKELYIEPKDEEIVGTFLSLAQVNDMEEIEAEPRPRRPKPHKKKEVNSRDIRDMFRIPKKKTNDDTNIIVLDKFLNMS